jgi:hypothetical protein
VKLTVAGVPGESTWVKVEGAADEGVSTQVTFIVTDVFTPTSRSIWSPVREIGNGIWTPKVTYAVGYNTPCE